MNENDSTTDQTKDNVQVMKGPRTKASLRKAIKGELAKTRIKEFKAKLKTLLIDREAAKKVLAAKDDEIDVLAEQYQDVIPE